MNTENENIENQETAGNQTEQTQAENVAAENAETQAETVDTEEVPSKEAELEAKCAKMHDDYIRLYAEFDNYKRRTLKEKSEMLQTAGKETIIKMIPLVDDFERAIAAMQNADDIAAVKEGVDHIYSKFQSFLASCNVKAIETEGQEFNTDFHEAIATIPAGDDMKNKIVDCTQKGYTMGEHVIRFAKVVIGK